MEKSTHAPPLSTLQAAAWWQKQTGRGPTGAAPPFEGCAPRWARAGQTREKFTRQRWPPTSTKWPWTVGEWELPASPSMGTGVQPRSRSLSPPSRHPTASRWRNSSRSGEVTALQGAGSLQASGKAPSPGQTLPSNAIPFSSPRLKATSRYLWEGTTFTRQIPTHAGAEHLRNHELERGTASRCCRAETSPPGDASRVTLLC